MSAALLAAVLGVFAGVLAIGVWVLWRLAGAVASLAVVLHQPIVTVRHGPILYQIQHTHRTEEPREPWQGEGP